MGQLTFHLQLGQGQVCHSLMHKIIFPPLFNKPAGRGTSPAFNNDGGNLRVDILLIRIGH